MAVFNPTLIELENCFHTITALLLGYDVTSSDSEIARIEEEKAARNIRMSWPTDGAPAWKINEDRTFIQVLFNDNDYTKQRELNYSRRSAITANQIFEMTNCLNISWVFYGPNSFSNSFKLFTGLLNPEIKRMLEEQKIFLLPDLTSPVRAPELFAAQWWERVNFSARFYYQIKIISEAPCLLETNISIDAIGSKSGASNLSIISQMTTDRAWVHVFKRIDQDNKAVNFELTDQLVTKIRISADSAPIILASAKVLDYVEGIWELTIPGSQLLSFYTEDEKQKELFFWANTDVVTDVGTVWSLMPTTKFVLHLGGSLADTRDFIELLID